MKKISKAKTAPKEGSQEEDATSTPPFYFLAEKGFFIFSWRHDRSIFRKMRTRDF